MSSPNARTRQHYRQLGHVCEIVEHWSPFPKPFGKRHDLLGVFDLILLRPGEIVGVQATTDAHLQNRAAKIKASPLAAEWLQAGGKILLTGWGKKGPRGKRKLWTMREVWLTAQDLQA